MNSKVTALKARSASEDAQIESVNAGRVPLSSLKFGHDYPGADIHARRSDRDTGLKELAASIANDGVLQSLLVCQSPERDGTFYVIAGNRRLAALQLLETSPAGEGHEPVTPAYAVPVIIRDVTPGTALALSLAESVNQVPLHPIDRYEAFAAIAGTPAEIAARFGTSELVVKQALKLGGLAKCVRAAWRAGEISADQAKAFAAADTAEEQEVEFARVRDGRGFKFTNADEIRKAFVKSESEAKRLLASVGRDAYIAAGGRLSEDLFGGGADGIAHDLGKLKKLAAAKLDAEAERLKAEGWSFAESSGLRVNNMVAHGAVKAQPKYTPVEKDRLKAIDARTKAISKEMEIAETDETPAGNERFDALSAEEEKLAAESERITREATFRGFSDAQKKKTGVAVAIDGEGHLRLVGGLAKPKGEAKAVKKSSSGGSSSSYQEPDLGWQAKRAMNDACDRAASELLAKDLPTAAAALLAGIAVGQRDAPYDYEYDGGGLTHLKDFGGAFASFRKLKPDAMLKLFGQVGAASIRSGSARSSWNALVQVLDQNAYAEGLAKHFERKTFFKHCSAKRLLATIKDALGADEERRQKDKGKDALAAFCSGSVPAGWLPPELRTKHYVAPKAKDASPASAKPSAKKKAGKK